MAHKFFISFKVSYIILDSYFFFQQSFLIVGKNHSIPIRNGLTLNENLIKLGRLQLEPLKG